MCLVDLRSIVCVIDLADVVSVVGLAGVVSVVGLASDGCCFVFDFCIMIYSSEQITITGGGLQKENFLDPLK